MKNIIACLVLIAALLMLTGCVHQDIAVTLNQNGTASVVLTRGYEEDYYDDLCDDDDVGPFNGKETFVYKYGGDTYIGVKEKYEFESYAALEKYLSELELEHEYMSTTDEGSEALKNATIFKNVDVSVSGTIVRRYKVHLETNLQYLGNNNKDSFGIMDCNDVFHVSLSISLPGDIEVCDGAEQKDGIIRCEFKDLTADNVIDIKSSQFNVVWLACIVTGAALIAVGLILLLMKTNGKKKVDVGEPAKAATHFVLTEYTEPQQFCNALGEELVNDNVKSMLLIVEEPQAAKYAVSDEKTGEVLLCASFCPTAEKGKIAVKMASYLNDTDELKQIIEKVTDYHYNKVGGLRYTMASDAEENVLNAAIKAGYRKQNGSNQFVLDKLNEIGIISSII